MLFQVVLNSVLKRVRFVRHCAAVVQPSCSAISIVQTQMEKRQRQWQAALQSVSEGPLTLL